MAATTFGGGPTTEQRSAFASYKEGTQTPGYRGHIPQIKYRCGHTYGEETSRIIREYGIEPSVIVGAVQSDSAPASRNVPVCNGNNKYAEKMVPGYTGYMPRLKFKFADTYKRKADDCIDEFLTNRTNHLAKMDELKQQTAAMPRLTAISHDPVVRDHLNMFRDTHPTRPILMGDKRGKYEAPIVGYAGFVPRIGPTQAGLGKPYAGQAQLGLNKFGREQTRQVGPQKELRPSQMGDVPLPGGGSSRNNKDSFPYDMLSDKYYSRRIYPHGGMIPNYFGYVPQFRFAFGHTFGDATRGLTVCSHSQPSYGAYLKTQPRPLPTVPC